MGEGYVNMINYTEIEQTFFVRKYKEDLENTHTHTLKCACVYVHKMKYL